MCIVSISEIGSLVPKENLENMCNNNDDGFGISFIENNEIKTHKTMNKKSFIKKAMVIQEKYHKKSHILIHCRIATHGLTNKENCHPFKINRSTVFAHNGILDCVDDDDILSDTRVFKNTYLKYLRTEFLDDKRMFSNMEDLIGIGNKIVFLTAEKNLKSQVYILNEKQGQIEKGIWYSNKSYKYGKFSSNTNYMYGGNYTLSSGWGNLDNYDIDNEQGVFTNYNMLDEEDLTYRRRPLRDTNAIEEIAQHNHVNKELVKSCDDIDYEEMYIEIYGDSPPYGYITNNAYSVE